jgi:hypothetical protein
MHVNIRSSDARSLFCPPCSEDDLPVSRSHRYSDFQYWYPTLNADFQRHRLIPAFFDPDVSWEGLVGSGGRVGLRYPVVRSLASFSRLSKPDHEATAIAISARQSATPSRGGSVFRSWSDMAAHWDWVALSGTRAGNIKSITPSGADC